MKTPLQTNRIAFSMVNVPAMKWPVTNTINKESVKILSALVVATLLLLSMSLQQAFAQGPPSGSGPGAGLLWSTSGNAGSSTSFLGTTDNFPLVFKTNGLERMRIHENGDILLNHVIGYAADYSLLFTDRSLVDKGWVMSQGFLTGNQPISLIGDVLGYGTTNIPVLVNWPAGFPAQDGRYLRQNGGIMTGPLTLFSDPLGAQDAATKQYVDNQILSIPPPIVPQLSDILNSGRNVDGSGMINDAGSIPAANLNARILFNQAGQVKVDWQSGYLYNSPGPLPAPVPVPGSLISLKWVSRELVAADGITTSLNWNSRNLQGGQWDYDADYSLSYTPRSLVDKAYVDNAVSSTPAANLASVMDAGANASLAGIINDHAGVLAINIAPGHFPGNRGLYDDLGRMSVNWQDRFLNSTSGFIEMDWEHGSLKNMGVETANWALRNLAGEWTAATPLPGDNSNKIATTAYVDAAVNSQGPDVFSLGAGANSAVNNLSGSNNANAPSSFIAAGSNNTIDANAQFGIILGGDNNEIQNFVIPVGTPPIHNLIGSGSGNTIQHNAHHAAILSGINNTLDDHFSLILGGENNFIEGSTDPTSYNTITNGLNNKISTNANHSSIIGGQNNIIAPGISGSVILGSYGITATQSNTVYLRQIAFPDGSIQTTAASPAASLWSAGPGQYSIVNNLSGSNNANALSSFIAAGSNNTIDANAYYGVILSGTGNYIQNIAPPGPSPYYNLIGNGTNNVVTHNANNAVILSGQNNIMDDHYSVILGGLNNTIEGIPTNDNSHNLITGGANNRIKKYASSSSIIGGVGNTIEESVYGAVILGRDFVTATESNTVYLSKIAFPDGSIQTSAYNGTGTEALSWQINGNGGTNHTTDFIGTTDVQDLVFKTNNEERIRIFEGGDHPGNVGIGTALPEKKLHIVTHHEICNNCTQTHQGIRMEDHLTDQQLNTTTINA